MEKIENSINYDSESLLLDRIEDLLSKLRKLNHYEDVLSGKADFVPMIKGQPISIDVKNVYCYQIGNLSKSVQKDLAYQLAQELDNKEKVENRFMYNNKSIFQSRLTDVRKGRVALENMIIKEIEQYNNLILSDAIKTPQTNNETKIRQYKAIADQKIKYKKEISNENDTIFEKGDGDINLWLGCFASDNYEKKKLI